MKQVIFKKVSIQNFLSVGNEPIVIDFKTGINIITGVNLDKEGSKNGVGKSCILDAINFCLFGETIRELKKDHIPNRYTKSTCQVSLEFDVVDTSNTNTYILTRSIEPTSLKLIHVGQPEPDITKSSIPKTTLFVEKLINCTAEVFQQSILMAVNNTVPFMAQKKVEKRKFIEGILKLGVFSEMLNTARLQYNDTKKESDLEKNALSDLITLLDKYYFQQNNFETLKIQKIQELNERKKQNDNEIEKLNNEVKSIDSKILSKSKKNLLLLEQKENEFTNKIHNYNTQISDLNSSINIIQQNIKDLKELGLYCNKCNRPFTVQDIEKINEQIKTNEEQIKTITTELTNANKELNQYKELAEKCNKGKFKVQNILHNFELTKSKNDNIKDRINHLTSLNKHIERDIEIETDRPSAFSHLIEESEAKKTALNDRVMQLCKKTDILEAVKFVVSEEGVKSFIVKKILSLLNNQLAMYLNKLDAPCKCIFNEYFEEVMTDNKGKKCSYHNFSGGERKRIDLAMLFTFQDIRRLQGDVMINLNMYDELLDSSLDGKGIEHILLILKERVRKHNEAIYIITHNPLAMNISVDNVIQLVKQNDITRLA